MDASILLYRQVIGQQDGRVNRWWSQQVWFMCCDFISQEPEVIAFPWWWALHVLQINLQLVGDTFCTVSKLTAADIEGVSHNRTCHGHASGMKEQEVGSQRAAQQSDEKEGNQAE